ncbi:unnamed protein product [Auanema sp. JU1783]|nr:unnamed protein product [Auanema sp. JU1783]
MLPFKSSAEMVICHLVYYPKLGKRDYSIRFVEEQDGLYRAADPPAHRGDHCQQLFILACNNMFLHLSIAALLLIPATDACIASGICGGLAGCFPPIPSVMPPCAGGIGCGPGYACGAFGCFRMRARTHGAGTLRMAGENRGPILMGADRFSQFRRPEPKDPNAMFMACCEQRGLPDACLQKCSFNTYTKQSLTRMYFKQDACPLSASAEIQFCAAQGRDHTACCARNGVTTTLAGDKCLTFCDQRPGNVTLLDFSYVACYDRFENMKACFWHDAVERLQK